MQVVVAAAIAGEHHARLPARGNAVHAQQRDQQQGLLAAVGMAGMQRVIADVAERGVFARTGPGNAIHGSKQLAQHFIRTCLALQYLVGEQLQRRGEAHMRQLLGQIGLQGRISRGWLYLGRVDRGMPGEDRDRVADLEARRLPSHCLGFQVRGALQGTGRCHPRLARGAAQPLHLFLLPGDLARVRNPRADRFTGGHHIGFHRERLGEFVALRQYRRLATLFGRGNHACVVGVEHFVGARRRHRCIRAAARACFVAEQEQVRRCALEVPTLAIGIEMLDQAELVPARKFLVGQIGNPAAHGRLGRGLVEGKIQADAAHALALEGPLGGIACRCQQRFGIAEATAVDQVDHLRLARPLLAAMPIRRLRGRHPQQQHGTQAGGGSQTRFANGRIHSDTSPARVVTAV